MTLRQAGFRCLWLFLWMLYAVGLRPVFAQHLVVDVKLDTHLDPTSVEWSHGGYESMCSCKLMCLSMLTCTGVSIHKEALGNFTCSFTGYYFPEPQFQPSTGDITLVKPQLNCPSEFFPLEQYGCFHMQMTGLGWDEASQFCQSRGAELFWATTPEELHIADFVMGEAGAIDWWVNVVGRKWVNIGRDVAMEEWYPMKPNGPLTECVVMKQLTSHEYLLDDRGCTAQYWFLCRKISAYS
ncbi:type-2 ice-structuring protein-like [Palaemon carinicauda]|uniref:type-2 ice-structuring protein-like n=1 Tax=Palaemon carinicauda TaxID=392227 RepID=UPI0035B5D429